MPNHLYDNLLAPRLEDSHPFLCFADGSDWSYRETLELSGQFAYALRELGVGAGDRVAVQAEKSPYILALYFACIRAGAAFLPLNTAYTANEVNYFISDAEPALLVCDAPRIEDYRKFTQSHGLELRVLDAGGTGDLRDIAARQPSDFAAVERTPDDLAAMLYTSGTTGRSKGVMLSHDNLLSNALVLADTWAFNREDVLLHGLPIYHTHGLFVATHVTVAASGSMWFLPKFDAAEVLRLMPRSSVMMGVPTHYTRLLEQESFNRNLTARMRLFISGSAPLLAETHREFELRTGHLILERYGMTETSMNTSNPYDGPRHAGSVGQPLPGVEVRITDPESGEPLPSDEIGSIEVRGPNVFHSYWRMPDKTAEEFRDDGYFITGDIGSIDEAGYLQIVGRSKDLIISGGLNIYPKEVELVIDEVDGIDESAVFGVPHPDFGEAVVAAVVARRPELTEADIYRAMEGKLARFKQPKSVKFMDALPRNTMGKVQKNRLREQYAALFEGSQS